MNKVRWKIWPISTYRLQEICKVEMKEVVFHVFFLNLIFLLKDMKNVNSIMKISSDGRKEKH